MKRAVDQNIFQCPPPYSGLNFPRDKTAHSMSPIGMMMPSHMQPPPMYGPRGSTIPPKFLGGYGKRFPQQLQTNFYCETCNRSFEFQSQLNEHIAEHRQCGIDGCGFVGHPSIISNHIEQQHATGLYDKLKNLNTPEEIAKWREERKKRYPTKANVELRQQLQAEKLKRGERLGPNKSRFGRRDDRQKCRDQTSAKPEASKDEKSNKRQRKRRKNKKRNEGGSQNQEKTGEKIAEEEDSENEGGFKKFKGTSKLADYSRPKAKTAITALASLAGLYGSDSENDSESNGEDDTENQLATEADNPDKVADSESTENATTETMENHPSPPLAGPSTTDEPCSDEICPINTKEPDHENSDAPSEDNEDQQEDVPFTKVVEDFSNEPRTSTETPATEATDEKSSRKRKRTRTKKNAAGETKAKPKYGLNYSKMSRRQNTMLEKLLQRDIIHERNVLLQCVRYVVQRNFFGIGQKSEAKEPTND